MTQVNPFIGIGSAVEFASVAAPTTYTTLNGVVSANKTGGKVATDKTTNMQSTSGADTYAAGSEEPGTYDVKAQWLPGDTTQVAFEAAKLARAVIPIRIVLPNVPGTSNPMGHVDFQGIVESMDHSLTIDKTSMLDIKIKISGPVTSTYGS